MISSYWLALELPKVGGELDGGNGVRKLRSNASVEYLERRLVKEFKKKDEILARTEVGLPFLAKAFRSVVGIVPQRKRILLMSSRNDTQDNNLLMR